MVKRRQAFGLGRDRITGTVHDHRPATDLEKSDWSFGNLDMPDEEIFAATSALDEPNTTKRVAHDATTVREQAPLKAGNNENEIELDDSSLDFLNQAEK